LFLQIESERGFAELKRVSTVVDMASVQTHKPELIELKDLMKLRPWNSASLPLSKAGGRYMKLKEPIYRNGVKVYWQPVIEEEEARNPRFRILCQALFKFFNTRIFCVIRRLLRKFFSWKHD